MLSNEEIINVVYALDDNYVKLLGVSLCSLLSNNQGNKICVFILDCGIDTENKNALDRLARGYGITLLWFDIQPYLLSSDWKSTNIYPKTVCGRLYVDLLPETIERILYLDCDTIINDDIKKLWSLDIGNAIVFGRKESLDFSMARSKSLNFRFSGNYINSGVLVIDINRYKRENCREKVMEVLNDPNQKLYFYDQDAINIALYGFINPNMPFDFNSPFVRGSRPTILHYGGSVARANLSFFRKLYCPYLNRTEWKNDTSLVSCSRHRRNKDRVLIALQDGYVPGGKALYSLSLKIHKLTKQWKKK